MGHPVYSHCVRASLPDDSGSLILWMTRPTKRLDLCVPLYVVDAFEYHASNAPEKKRESAKLVHFASVFLRVTDGARTPMNALLFVGVLHFSHELVTCLYC